MQTTRPKRQRAEVSYYEGYSEGGEEEDLESEVAPAEESEFDNESEDEDQPADKVSAQMLDRVSSQTSILMACR